MQLNESPRLIEIFKSQDSRGDFQKIFPLRGEKLDFAVEEVFSTWNSAQGTIRGMHFQTGASAANKIVWVEKGEVLDVCVNITSGTNYGKLETFHLGARSGMVLFVPKGWAHGYQTLADDTVVYYLMDHPFDSANDSGINALLPNFSWPLNISNISVRDKNLPAINEGYAYE